VAVGASRGDIARLVLGDAGRVMLAGTAAGIVVALLVTRPLAMFLVPGLKPGDPANYAAVTLAMLVTGFAATSGAVLRALKIDPNTALREE
jgi:ABC-type antimicrobial peptide transport system permease subunit